jgi:hypothetical protein
MAHSFGIRDDHAFMLKVADGSGNSQVTLNLTSDDKSIIFENSFSFVRSLWGMLLTHF